MLIERGSKLSVHLEDLKKEGRLLRLTEVIAHLKEAEDGFTPKEIEGLL